METCHKLSPFLYFSLLILSYSTFTTADTPNCNAQDQAVLIKIRDHFGGPNGPLSDWDNNSDCCDYSGVGCNSNPGNEYGRVNAVTFSRSGGLKGTIPPDFGDLPYLDFLIIAGSTGITGSIPSSLGKLTRLYHIELDSNSLTGPIPPSVSSLPKLSFFNVSHNQLSGSLPSFSSKSLKSFDVSYNQLCGAIPSTLKSFSQASFANNKCLCGPPLSPCKS